MINRGLLTSKLQTWATPTDADSLFVAFNKAFRFTFDACALKATAKVPRFASPGSNGLRVPWRGERVFSNPPYDQIDDWTLKARDEALCDGVISANLVPYRPDPEWWATNVLQEDGNAGRLLCSHYDPAPARVMWLRFDFLIVGIHSHPGRIKFEMGGKKKGTAPFPSAVVMYGPPGKEPPGASIFTKRWPC